MACAKLVRYLRDIGIPFELGSHREGVCTAQEVAGALGVRGRQFAKVVMVVADGRLMMLVVPAHHRIIFGKQLNQTLVAKRVCLAKEEEFAGCFGERRQFCEAGAMCPFGHLYGFKVFMDSALVTVPEIVFRAGTHHDVIEIATADYLRLVNPQIAQLSVPARGKKAKRKRKSWLRRLLGL
ncbi:MAG: YbaK/EbsC family protein [Candidatus Cloacimonetes bacterium]|nr:YbaK/EbsC family protein [Candidatus Cloacimonadota bacterium]